MLMREKKHNHHIIDSTLEAYLGNWRPGCLCSIYGLQRGVLIIDLYLEDVDIWWDSIVCFPPCRTVKLPSSLSLSHTNL